MAALLKLTARISTGNIVPSLRRWLVSKVTVSPRATALPQIAESMPRPGRHRNRAGACRSVLPAVAQTDTGLAIDVENGLIDRRTEKKHPWRDPRKCGIAPRLRAALLLAPSRPAMSQRKPPSAQYRPDHQPGIRTTAARRSSSGRLRRRSIERPRRRSCPAAKPARSKSHRQRTSSRRQSQS